MASKDKLKEIIRSYVLENKAKFMEADEDGDGIDDEIDVQIDKPIDSEDDTSGEQAFEALLTILDQTGTRISTILKRVDSTKEKMDILNAMVDTVLNGFNTRQDLPNSTLKNYFIQKFGGSDEMAETSTTAGAPAPATKYAYKLKKKLKKES